MGPRWNSAREVVATRRALYDLAQELPMQRLAPLLGVTDVALGKLFGRFDIDRLSRGDWERERHHRPVRRTPLRRAPEGMSEIVRFGRGVKTRQLRGAEGDRELIALLARDAQAAPVEIRTDLRRAHPVVRRGAGAAERLPYLGEDNLPRPAAEYVMAVSKPQSQRALRVLDAVFRAVESRGIRLRLARDTPRPELRLELLGVELGLHLRHHKVSRRRAATGPSRLVPGEPPNQGLVLSVRTLDGVHERRWGGTGERTIEHRINLIPSAVIALAAAARHGGRREAGPK